MIFYTSDPHYHHRNIIKYCSRPFSSIEEMHEQLIERWNAKVSDTDDVYLLGDFVFAKQNEAQIVAQKILDQLNGNIYFVPGNHDSKPIKIMTQQLNPAGVRYGKKGWKDVSPLMEIKDNGRHVVLCHFQMKVWNRSHHGSYHLFGHSHGSLEGTTQSTDVGVDCWDFTPVTLDECIERMQSHPAFPRIHHNKEY